jgi:Holliday junction DNA helicase RuvA
MISFVEGPLIEKTPTYAVINCHGIGYHIHISLNTFSKIGSETFVRLYTHQVIREDAHLLYGFFDQQERSLFRHLITVQGVGAGSARMILSSLSISELYQAIIQDQAGVLQTVKGIGAKTAQKIVLELRDKLSKEELQSGLFVPSHNTIGKEALSALITLGFPKNQAEKAVARIINDKGESGSVENLIKDALKLL